MPRSLQHLTCCFALAAAIQAGAPTTGTASTPVAESASEEMLRLWQLRDSVDPAPQSVTPFEAPSETGTDAFDAPPRTWRLESRTPASTPRPAGLIPPGSPSMTPNLDRLLQRSYQPLVPSDAPHVTSTATRAPWGGYGYSKSGSTTVSGGDRDKRDKRHSPPGRDGHGRDGHGRDGHGGDDCGPSTPTPEPATMLLFGGAAAAAAAVRKRRRAN